MRIRPLVAITSFAIGLVPLAVACKHDNATPDQAAGGGGKGGRMRGGGEGGIAYAVDILRVDAKKVDYVVQAPGTVEAFERVQVTSRVAGAVDRVAFTEGQEVKQGDTLVVIDSERYQLAVNSAKAAMAKTQASEAETNEQVKRREGAIESHPGLIPGEELETYKTKLLTAKADTAVADEALKTAQVNLRDSYVKSPINGVIQTRTVETGQYVAAGAVMATLLRQDPMLLKFDVEPQDAPRLKVGMTANFTMRETQKSFEAKITLVAGSADPTSHMVNVTGEVQSKEKYWLRPGSFCDVQVNLGAPREMPVIPRLATRATDHGYVTYVVENEVAQEKVITLGMSTKDGWIEVRSGLNAGDWIVVHGAEALTPGARVRSTRVESVDAGVTLTSGPSLVEVDGGGGAWAGGGHREGGAGGSGGGGGHGKGAPPAGSAAP
jgi:RND family efflux transporter MFP subunit